MAKVTGPLFSVDASGSYAGKLTFAKWKGVQYVRNKVVPSNPMTTGQVEARNDVRVTGASQRFANLTTEKGSGRLLTDKQLLTAAAPAGTAWNGHLTKLMIGSGGATMAAGQVAYAALGAPDKASWVAAAAALTPPIPAVVQKLAENAAGTSLTAGEVFFLYQTGLAAGGIAPTPGAAPPAYA